jgi:hypothetical protein
MAKRHDETELATAKPEFAVLADSGSPIADHFFLPG